MIAPFIEGLSENISEGDKGNVERTPYLNLLKFFVATPISLLASPRPLRHIKDRPHNESSANAMTPPLIVHKKLVAPGPGLEPIEILEAISPRKSGMQLIRAVPFAQARNGNGATARAKHKVKSRPKPLTQTALATLSQESGYHPIHTWLDSMELTERTHYAAECAALAAASEAECAEMFSGSDVSECSTVGGDGGTFGLGIIVRRVGRKPFNFVRAAARPFLRALTPKPVLDALEWPVSYALADCDE